MKPITTAILSVLFIIATLLGTTSPYEHVFAANRSNTAAFPALCSLNIITAVDNQSTEDVWVTATRENPSKPGECEYVQTLILAGTKTSVIQDTEAIWVRCVANEPGCEQGIRPFKLGDCANNLCTVTGSKGSLNLSGLTICSKKKAHPSWKCGWVDRTSGWPDPVRDQVQEWPAPNASLVRYSLSTNQWICQPSDLCITNRPTPPLGSVDGFVKSSTNNVPITGVNVTLTNTSQTYSTKTDQQGHYLFQGIATGAVKISAQQGSAVGSVQLNVIANANTRAPDIIMKTNSTTPPSQCAAPVLVSPKDSETVHSHSLNMVWNAPNCIGLSGYTLHITTGSGPEDGIIFDQGVGPTSYTFAFPRDGTFYWHVAAWSNSKRGPWASRRVVIDTSTAAPPPADCDAGTDGIVLYEDVNFQGRCRNFRGDEPNFGNVSGWLNDRASSIQFRGYYVGRYEVTLFKSANYGDARGPFRDSIADLSTVDINDSASSMRIQALPCTPSPDQVSLHFERNYGGACVILGIGNYADPGQLAPVGNDAAWSIRVGSNVQATLYSNANFDGTAMTFTSDNPDLGFTPIGGGTSSVKVEARPQAPPPPTPAPTAAPAPPPASSGCTVPTNSFCAEYYANRTLSGQPAFTQTEATIDHQWGKGGPGKGLGNDNYSVRWVGRFTFNNAPYTFRAKADDGVRLWVDNDLVIDQWHDQRASEFTGTRTLSGDHTVKVEYYERSGGASIHVEWSAQAAPPPTSFQPAQWSSDQWQATSDLAGVSGVTHGGSRAARIASATANDARWLQTVAVKPNTSYVLTGWVKTENVANSGQSVDAGANLCLFGTWMRSDPVFGTTDWRLVTLEFNSGDSSQIVVGARLGYWSGTTTGTAWFDDLELHEKTSQGQGPNLLQNGGFEQ